MDPQAQQIVDRIKQANNILVTVSANPSVDQLAACVGLTIMLNELGKHGTAVFSGVVPSTLEFLQPEKTLEKNTDSLRDFIISLDKSKADKLRYKVEDKVVKIFITPYRTSISEKDFEFSQGDFNVELVLALGVHDQKDLDQAITAHGRILHDATVATINTTTGNNLGTINWQDTKASSLSEMVTRLTENFDKKVLDSQVATALLTGIVAETQRFSNSKTSPETMKASAQLMTAGANQELVATKLETPPLAPQPPAQPPVSRKLPEPPKSNDGTLHIDHVDEPSTHTQPIAKMGGQEPPDKVSEPEPVPTPAPPKPPEPRVQTPKPPKPPELLEPPQPLLPPELPPEPPVPSAPEPPQIHLDNQVKSYRFTNESRGFLGEAGQADNPGAMPSSDDEEKPSGMPSASSRIDFTPPSLGGTLTANSQPEGLDPSTDPFSSTHATNAPLLEHNNAPTKSQNPRDESPIVVQPNFTPPPVNSSSNDSTPALPSNLMPSTSAPAPDVTLPNPWAMQGPEPSTPVHTVEPEIVAPTPPVPAATPTEEEHQTLSDIEESVHSSHLKPADLHGARDAVNSAIEAADGQGDMPAPIVGLNAQPLSDDLHIDDSDDSKADEKPAAPVSGSSEHAKQSSAKLAEPLEGEPEPSDKSDEPPEHAKRSFAPATSKLAEPLGDEPASDDKPSTDMPLPPTIMPPPGGSSSTSSDKNDPSAPPPVPPPMMPLITPMND